MTTAAADLRLYLSGARNDGDAQVDSSKSLGGWRSGSLAQSMAHTLSTWIDGLRVVYVSGPCGEGTHQIEATGASAVRFAADGDGFGAEVTIANGQTKVLYSETGTKWCLVSRERAADLSGVAQVQTWLIDGGAAGMDVCFYGGSADYRMLVFKNESASALTGCKVWVDSGATGLALALDTPDDTGFYREATREGEATAPPGTLSFSSPTSEGSGLSFTLAAGEAVGLWIKRTPPGSGSPEQLTQKLHYSFGGIEQTLSGKCWIGDSTLDGWLLYVGQDEAPDFTSPTDTFASLPDTYALAPDHTYNVVLRRRNAFGLISQNITTTQIIVASDGTQSLPAPSAPTELSLTALRGGMVRAHAVYNPEADGDNAADSFGVWLAVGSDATATGDPDLTFAFGDDDGVAPGGPVTLDIVSEAFDEGDDVHALIRVFRSSDSAQSTNTANVTATALAALDAPDEAETDINTTSPADVYVIASSGTEAVQVDINREVLQFIVGGEVKLAISRAGTVLSEIDLVEGSVSETVTGPITFSGGAIVLAAADPAVAVAKITSTQFIAALFSEVVDLESVWLGLWGDYDTWHRVNAVNELLFTADRKYVGMNVGTDGTIRFRRARDNG